MSGKSHIALNVLAAPLVASYVLPTQGISVSLQWDCVSSLLAFSIPLILCAKLPDQIEVLKFLGHRTWSHSIVPWGVLCFACYYQLSESHVVLRLAVLGGLAGFLLHLLEDAASKAGIPLLVSGPKLRLALYKTGGLSEILFVCVMGALLILATIWKGVHL